MIMDRCFTCRTLPAGNELAGPYSAYCRYCQPWPSARTPAPGDTPPAMTAGEAMAVLAQFVTA